MNKTELKTLIANHSSKSGEILTDQEITDCANDLISLFTLLIEADKDLMKTHEPSTRRNPDSTN